MPPKLDPIKKYQEYAAELGNLIAYIKSNLNEDLPKKVHATKSPTFFDEFTVDPDIFSTIKTHIKSLHEQKNMAGIDKPIIEYIKESLLLKI